MTIYRIQAPNGDILRIEGPEGVSQEEIMAYAESVWQPPAPKEEAIDKDVRRFQEAKAAKEKADAATRTWGEFAGDTARSLTQGAIDATAGVGGFLYGAATGDYDNTSSEFARGMNEVLQEGKSAKARLQGEAVQKAMAAADGGWEKAAVGGWETLKNPTMLADQVARSLPGMYAGGIVGRGATAVTQGVGNAMLRAAPDVASKMATTGLKVGTVAPQVAGPVAEAVAALTQGSSVAGDTYEEAMKVPIEVYAQQEGFKKLADKVGAEEAKRVMASDATTRAGLMGSLASALSMRAIPGGNAIERMFVPKVAGEAAEAAGKTMLTKPLTKGFAGGIASKAGEVAIKGTAVGASEALSESAEDGLGAVAKALEVSRITGEVPDLGAVFAEAAGQAAPVGFLMGKVTGMRSDAPEAPPPAPKVEDQSTTPQAPAPKAPTTSAQSILEREAALDGETNGTQAPKAEQTEAQGQEAPIIQPPIKTDNSAPAQPASDAGQGAGGSQPTQVLPTVADLDPGQLLRVAQDPNHPMADAATVELKRREVEYLYQQREVQQQAQREADARPLIDEAVDQQVAQVDAVVNAQNLEAPTAMAAAFAQAKLMKPKATGLAAELEAIKARASGATTPVNTAQAATEKVAEPGPADLSNYIPALPKAQSSMQALQREIETIRARNGYPAAPAATEAQAAPDSAAAVGMPAPVATMPPVATAAPAMPAVGAVAKAAKTVAAPIPGGGFSSPETMAVDGKDVSTLAPTKGYEPNSEFALGMPTFKGNKRTMLGMAVSAVRQHMDGGSKITQVDDWFGGGGMWSTALANATLPNVKKIRISELNPLRIKRIQWMHERGDKMFDDMQRTGALNVYRNLLADFKANVDPKTGAAAPIVSPSPFEQIGLSLAGFDDVGELAKKRAIAAGAVDLSDEGKIILSLLGDLAFNNRGSKIHQASKLELPDGTVADKFLAKAMYEMAAAHKQAQAFKARGGVYEYFPAGSSFDLVGNNAVPGDHVLSLADPPYYNTSGYKGAGDFSTGDKWNANGYAASRDLLKTLVDKGNHILYTDEAWWRKDNQLPDANQAGAILGQINQHLSGLHVAPEKVGGRYEQLGIHNPNARRGGNIGSNSSQVQGYPTDKSGSGDGLRAPNGPVAQGAGGQGGGTAGAPGLKLSTAAPVPRHAASTMNKAATIPALVPVGPGTGDVVNIAEYFGNAQQQAAPKRSVAMRAPAAPRNLNRDVTLTIPIEGGGTAKMTVNAQSYIDQLNKRQQALEMVKECMA